MYLLNFLPWKVPFVFFKEMNKKIIKDHDYSVLMKK